VNIFLPGFKGKSKFLKLDGKLNLRRVLRQSSYLNALMIDMKQAINRLENDFTWGIVCAHDG